MNKDDNTNDNMPRLVVEDTPWGEMSGLDGWDDLDRWACHNVRVWKETRMMTSQWTSLPEKNRLRVLAERLLRAYLESVDAAVKKDWREASPTFVLPASPPVIRRGVLGRLISWINRLTSPEGCTAWDAQVLRNANHILSSRLDARGLVVARLKGELEELKRREAGQ